MNAPVSSLMPRAITVNLSSRRPSSLISAPATGMAVASEVTAKRTRASSSTALSVRSVTCTRIQSRLAPSTARSPTR